MKMTIYMLNAGGIYGGYYKDKEMKQIIPRSVILQLKLRDDNSVSDFWRGTESDYTDFYALIPTYLDNGKETVKLAHIKRKGA